MTRRPRNRPDEPASGVAAAPEPTPKASRGRAALLAHLRAAGALELAVLALGIAAAVLMVLTEISTLFFVEVGTGPSCEDLASSTVAETCSTTGGEQHSFALLLLAVLAAGLSLGAALADSRAAARALLVVGLVVLGIALVLDLPDTAREGAIGERYTQAESRKGAGFAYELGAGVLATLAGGLAVARRRD